MLIDGRDHARIASGNGIRRVDHGRRVGIGNVDRVDRRKISHERHDAAIGRQVERDLRFGGEAGDHLVLARRRTAVRAVGHFERVDQLAGGPQLIQHDLRGDAEAGIGNHIIPHGRIRAIIGGGDAIRSDAVRRQGFVDRDSRRLVVIDRTADQQISRLELNAVIIGKSARGAGESRYKKCNGQTCLKDRQPVKRAQPCTVHRKTPLFSLAHRGFANVAQLYYNHKNAIRMGTEKLQIRRGATDPRTDRRHPQFQD